MLVDAHSHIFRGLTESTGEPDTEIDVFIEDHEEAGFEKIACVAQDMSRLRGTSIPHEPIIELMEEYPEKIIGIASAEPLKRNGEFNREGLEFFVKSVEEMRFEGLMLGPGYTYFKPNDKRVYPFYQKAIELDVPIYFHLAAWWENSGPMLYGRPWLLDEVIRDFPNLKINIEHMGYPWTNEVLALMGRSDTVFTDVAYMGKYQKEVDATEAMAMKGSNILTWNLVKAKEMGVIDQVLYGTDYPFGEKMNLKAEVEWFETELNKNSEKSGWLKFTDEEIEGILGNNAKKLFGL